MVALAILVVPASGYIAGAYALAQVVPVGLFAAMTVFTGIRAGRAVTRAGWIAGMVAHLVAMPLYAAWVFYWTFVFGMDKRASEFIDRSLAFSILYAAGLGLIAILFAVLKPQSGQDGGSA